MKQKGDPSEKVALFPGSQRKEVKRGCVQFRYGVKKHCFLLLIILALVGGFALGVGLRHLEKPLTSRQISYVRFPGDLFLQMLSMLLIPLIVSSIITATTSLTPKSSGRMGVISLIYYISTSLLAVLTAILLVLLIEPGSSHSLDSDEWDVLKNDNITASAEETVHTLMDVIRNLFPPNIVEASFKRLKTEDVLVPEDIFSRPTVMKTVTTTGYTDGTNVLGIIAFSLALGLIISKLGNEGRPLAGFFEALNLAVMKMISLVIWFAPIGVMSLIASKVVEVDEPLTVLHKLSWFVITVVTGFAIHGILTLPIAFAIITRRNPFSYLGNMLEALITVFSTASSAATLPVTIRCLVENNNVDSRVVHFVTPVGTTVNMDGSAIYQVIAAIFLAQFSSMTLSAGQIATVGITSIAASIGSAPIPSGSLVVMVMVLTSVGIPTDIALLAAVDWLLDRFRGMINVEGDAFAAGIVASLAKDGLHKERVIVEHSLFGLKETSLTHKDDYYELP